MSGRYLLDTNIIIALFADEAAVMAGKKNDYKRLNDRQSKNSGRVA
jgi:hypothetical protein